MAIVAQGFRWAVKAVGGLLLNIGLLTVWVEWVGLPPSIAIIPNWVVLSVLGYIVVNWWVFAGGQQPDSLRGHVRRFAASEAVMLSSKGLNFIIYWILVFVSVPYQAAWVIGAVVTVAVSFSGNKALWSGSDVDVDQ